MRKTLILLVALLCRIAPHAPAAAPQTASNPQPEGVLPGWFSVAPNEQVRFAQGNVQYQPSTNTWRFAEHQYDFVGDDEVGNVYVGDTKSDNTQVHINLYDGWLDLFNWGSAATPTDYKSTPALDESGTFVDWGCNPFSNGGNKNNIWRTLTDAEWTYLFDQRTNAKQLRGQAVVADAKGYILLPDDWQQPDGLTFKPEPNNHTTNVYSREQWEKMEDAGAVFLPGAGTRQLRWMVTPNGDGSYWSSTRSQTDDDQAFTAWFYIRGSGAGFEQRVFDAMSVRLVQDRALMEYAKTAPQQARALSAQQENKTLNLPELEPAQEWKLYDDMHVVGDINPREGFRRVKLPEGSFGAYLRNLPLADDWTGYYYNGQVVKPQFGIYAVIDREIGKRDLIQCADAIMLLRAEYLYYQKRYEEIHFNSVSGKRMNYLDYVKGDYSYAKFRKYIDYVAAYASTLSLEKELKPRKIEDVQVGDVFIVGGSPGHAMIVVDLAMDAQGNRALLFAQGMMPAQSIHVVTNLAHKEDTPWYMIDKYLEWGTLFEFPDYVFSTSELKCFE